MSEQKKKATVMEIPEIMQYLPHRYPFLFLDGVEELVEHSHIVAYKGITFNEEVFQGHFPGAPVFPGVLIVEALTQACALLGFRSLNMRYDQQLCYLAKLGNFRFFNRVVPGDHLVLKGRFLRSKKEVGVFAVEACVDGETVTSGDVTCIYKPVEKN